MRNFLAFIFGIFLLHVGEASARFHVNYMEGCNPYFYKQCEYFSPKDMYCPKVGSDIHCKGVSSGKAECCLDLPGGDTAVTALATIYRPHCSEYINDNGKLKHVKNRRYCIPAVELSGHSSKLKELGSYSKSCKGCEIKGHELVCKSCPDKTGKKRPARIRLHKKDCNRAYYLQDHLLEATQLKRTRGQLCYQAGQCSHETLVQRTMHLIWIAAAVFLVYRVAIPRHRLR